MSTLELIGTCLVIGVMFLVAAFSWWRNERRLDRLDAKLRLDILLIEAAGAITPTDRAAIEKSAKEMANRG